jgi:hypothetical protein
MGRKKNAPPAASPVAEDFAKDEPLHQPPVEVPAKPKTIDMVRAAIAAGKSMPKEGIAWIKETFDFDIKIGNFSVNKSTIDRAAGKVATPRAPKKQSLAPRQITQQPVAVIVAPAPKPIAHSNGKMTPSEAARSVKELVDKLGVKEVKNLVELFGG